MAQSTGNPYRDFLRQAHQALVSNVRESEVHLANAQERLKWAEQALKEHREVLSQFQRDTGEGL